jgi:hypothetical protein
MSIEVNERTVGFWFVTIPNGDWMAGLQALDGGRFKLQYRFRYYKDSKAFGSDDKKNWYSGEGDDYGSAVRTSYKSRRRARCGRFCGATGPLMTSWPNL